MRTLGCSSAEWEPIKKTSAFTIFFLSNKLLKTYLLLGVIWFFMCGGCWGPDSVRHFSISFKGQTLHSAWTRRVIDGGFMSARRAASCVSWRPSLCFLLSRNPVAEPLPPSADMKLKINLRPSNLQTVILLSVPPSPQPGSFFLSSFSPPPPHLSEAQMTKWL